MKTCLGSGDEWWFMDMAEAKEFKDGTGEGRGFASSQTDLDKYFC